MEQLEIPVGEMVFTARAAGPEEGELVLLLHGFPQTSWSWRHQIMALAEAGYRVVAPDQRGYSPGARPAALEQYATSHLVADVLGIADEVGGHTFHLAGHDWGAAVAWQVAGRYPQRLRTLTAVSVPHPQAFGRSLAGEAGSDQAQRSSYIDFFRSAEAEDVLLAGDAAVLRNVYRGSGLDDFDEYLAVLSERSALTAALNWYRAAELTSVEGLGPITMPTLYVWSTDDVALGREAAEWTAAYVEGPYHFEVLEGVSHWVPEEAPERLNDLLIEHLARGSRP
jgi:pimeloyl-ACP methyl ester carboxylesterase